MEDNQDLNNYSIKSLIKSMEVIEKLIENGAMSIGELSNMTGMGKSSVHRVLGTFKQIGYVKQDSQNGKYYPSIKIFELGNLIGDRIPLKSIVRKNLEKLYERCHETVNVSILDNFDIVFLDKIITKEPLRIVLEVGRRIPAYCSGMGKVLLAYTDNINLGDIEFKKYSENTVDSIEEIEKELANIRQQGYAIDREEYIKGLICIAVPIKNRRGEVIAAMSIATPAVRIDQQKIEEYLSILFDVSGNMTKEMGY